VTSYFAVPESKGRIPKSELSGILKSMESILKSWADLSARFIGAPAEGPADLPLEFSVLFSSPYCVF
jgi:hypothetical protein